MAELRAVQDVRMVLRHEGSSTPGCHTGRLTSLIINGGNGCKDLAYGALTKKAAVLTQES